MCSNLKRFQSYHCPFQKSLNRKEKFRGVNCFTEEILLIAYKYTIPAPRTQVLLKFKSIEVKKIVHLLEVQKILRIQFEII